MRKEIVMKINHRKAHAEEDLNHSTARFESTPRLKSAVKKVANFVVILLR